MTCFRRVGLQLVIGVRPKMNENLGGLSNRILSENCPKNYIGKLSNSSRRRMSNGLFWRVVQQFTSEGCPQSKQIDLFGNNFHTWHKHLCESR